MQPDSSTRRSGFLLVFRAALLLAGAALGAACDRHSAVEAPEDYGHGSSHERVVPDHQIDSSYHSRHFSDTAGTKDEAAEAARETPAASATPGPTVSRF